MCLELPEAPNTFFRPATDDRVFSLITEAIAPPADRPVTKMRLRSTPYLSTALAIISRMDSLAAIARGVAR